jgi:hypothetical protein
MTVEAIVLALASAVRPSTSLAAVYALLSTPRPRPLLIVFVLAGTAFSVAIGTLVVSVFHGVHVPRRDSSLTDVVDLLAGVAALGFAVGAHASRTRRAGRERPARNGSRIVRRLHDPTVRVAGAAGALTHLPGLFYLVALTAIAQSGPGLATAFAEVVAYNVIWFSVPIGAAVLAWRRPEQARALMGRANEWARRHRDTLMVTLFAAVGAFLTLKGAVGLLG